MNMNLLTAYRTVWDKWNELSEHHDDRRTVLAFAALATQSGDSPASEQDYQLASKLAEGNGDENLRDALRIILESEIRVLLTRFEVASKEANKANASLRALQGVKI